MTWGEFKLFVDNQVPEDTIIDYIEFEPLEDDTPTITFTKGVTIRMVQITDHLVVTHVPYEPVVLKKI